MTPLTRGLVLGVLQVALVSSLGAKLLVDRAIRPRVWARVVPYDPDAPVRGRYVRLRVVVKARGVPPLARDTPVTLAVENGELVAVEGPGANGARVAPGPEGATVLDEPLAYFIPEHVPDPSRRAPGEELWVEVTLPREGPPRPIRLGVKKSGVLTPLALG